MIVIGDYIERVRGINAGLEIRKATLADAPNFVSLFNQYYNRKTSMAYFEWQFFNSPIPSTLFVAYDSDKLVGYYGIKIHKLSNGGFTGFVIDVLIHDSYRKKGILFLLEWEAEKVCMESGVSVMTALPNVHGQAALKALGWKTIQKINKLHVEEFAATPSVPEKVPSNASVNAVRFLKDADYRRWRFDRNPTYRYEVITVNKSTATTKLFVEPATGIVYGDIVDVDIFDASDSSRLIYEAISRMREKNVVSITTWSMPHTHLYPVFRAVGFKESPQERYFCVKVVQKEYSMLEDIMNWDLVQADAEIF